MRSVIIAGSRSVSPAVLDIDEAIRLLDPGGLLWVPSEWTEVVCGGARGADSAGEDWAKHHGISVAYDLVLPADYHQHGKLAPKIRNRRMAERADAALIFWDGMSGGSADMCCRMVARGKPVAVIPWRSSR